MPRSKRDRQVPLARTKPKSRDAKGELIDRVREAVDQHRGLFVLSFDELRATHLQEVRLAWRDSGKIFMGKNTVMRVALGATPEDEFHDNLRHVAKALSGSVCLLATDRPREEVVGWCREFEIEDFAKQGFVARSSVTLERGPLTQFPVSMMAELRKLGLQAEINNSALHLMDDFVVCARNKPVTAEQARMLVHLGLKLVKFRMRVRCHWTEGTFTELDNR